ncbi:MAG: NADH-quinone oxidoreductase subunit L, partial [Vicinamibacteria bacterium]
MSELFWLIPLIPGIGAIVNGFFGNRLPKNVVAFVACGVVAVSFLIALACFFGVFLADGPETVLETTLFSWIPGMSAAQAGGGTRDFLVDWEYRLDSLSMVMVLVVTGIGLLIHIYSVGYMSHDPGFGRFFTYLNMFTLFMLNLVMGANFLIAFIGWEGVGLCSYLLIGFWFDRDAAASAGKKAFIVNRIGDAGFILAIMMIFYHFGSVDFYEVMQSVAARFDTAEVGFGLLSIIGILLFVGAVGKSAQIPLYVWLPDAMEGPTPVSALIHAATMVTAGVYMTARCGVLYQHAPAAMSVVATIGVATAILAASIGLFQNDIKKVLAYSTVSQLGFMFLGAGVGAFAAAIFHLMTHAFFKACLFLGSGSVIHAMEHAEHGSGGHRDYTEMQDMRNMGGLYRHMPWTARTFIVAAIAIAGIPPLAGFVSKDEILWRATGGGHVTPLWIVAALAAGMTAFYMTRQVILTFFGNFRGGEKMESHLHEAPKVMWLPLVILAMGAVVAGFVGWPHFLGGHNRIEAFLEPAIMAGTHPVAEAAAHEASAALEWTFMLISVAIAASAIIVAYRMYRDRPQADEIVSGAWPGLYRLLYNKYYVDEIYGKTVVAGTIETAHGLHKFDAEVVDGIVNGTAKFTLEAADLSNL